MKVKDIIYLQNNEKYTLISSCEYKNKKYFLAVGFKDEKNVDLENMVVFELVGEKGVVKIVDKQLLMELMPILHGAMK